MKDSISVTRIVWGLFFSSPFVSDWHTCTSQTQDKSDAEELETHHETLLAGTK